MRSDLRLALYIALGLLGAGMAIGWIGLGPTPAAQILGHLRSESLPLSVGPYAVFFAAVFFCAITDRRALAMAAAAGIAGGVAHLALHDVPSLQGMKALYYALVFGLWLGTASLAALAWLALRGADADARRTARDALAGCLFITLWSAFLYTYLQATVVLHPTTFDAPLHRFEATLGFQAAPLAARWVAGAPPVAGLLDLVYEYLAFGYAVLYGLTLRRRGNPPVNLLLVWALGGMCGFIAYHLLPAAGPRYLFGALFPNGLPPVEAVPATPTIVTPSPRNAMPSLHTGWAIILWAYARLFGSRWIERACIALTLAATLAKGEHYLIDLVVAMPFIAAVLTASLRKVSWDDPRKRLAVVSGFGVWLAWIVGLRFGLKAFESVPGLAWLAIAATVIHGASLYRTFFLLARGVPEAPAAAPARAAVPAGLGAATALFLVSGFTALVYEVVFSKSLALVFGSMATATYTVLATYMGGMALGAWLGGRIAARRDDPLLIYAVCEGAIGLYSAATPFIFDGIRAAYVPLAAGLPPDAPVLVALRVLLGAGALAVPTVLMGMTLPAMARFFEVARESMGRSVAALYGANTLGAALGALLAGYAVLPALGLTRSIIVTAVGSVVVGLFALQLRERSAGAARAAPAATPRPAGAGAAPHRGFLALALVALFVTGLVTLALEVLYMHLLAIVAGNSVYAFSLMLFTFLVGLGGGAAAARRLLRLRQPLAATLGWLQLGIAAVALFGVLQWERIPYYFAAYVAYPVELGFGQREAIRAAVCFVAMLPPAFLIGALYPLSIELATRSSRAAAVGVLGRAAAVNTLGNIAGVLLAGFIMLPLLGSIASIRVLAALAFGLGLVCLWMVRSEIPRLAWAPVAVVLAAIAVQPRSLDYEALASGANVYFHAQDWGEVVAHAESADGGLSSVAANAQPGGVLRTLLTNGKFQGNNATGGEMKAQAGFALAPLLHTPRRERALVIGYGTGGSAYTVHAAGFAELDIVELSADIVRLADRYFPEVNRGVTSRPGVRTFVTDGRNFLMLQPRTYDLISIEISSIWFAGAANLYNREFYQLAKARLAPGGVLQQWIQLHHIRPHDVLFVLGSVRSEFRFVWIYLLGEQGIIVATNDPSARPDPAHMRQLERAPGLKDILALYDGHLDEVRDGVLIDPRGVELFLGAFNAPREAWISTDDNLVLEYGTPKGNALKAKESMARNLETLRTFQAQAVAAAR
jgi:predicted membrane-bound spermidine synthase